MRRAHLALTLLALASCERAPRRREAPPVAFDVPAAQAIRDVVAPDVAPDVAPEVGAEPAAPRATTPAVVDLNATPVDRLVGVGDGAVLVRAMNREGRRSTDLIATRLDADGAPVGVPRLLRRTTGPVVALDVSARGDDVWIAWGSARPAGQGRADYLVAAMRATRDLATVERPITVHDFRAMEGDAAEMAPQAIARLEVGVIAAPNRGAVVTSSAPFTRCEHGDPERPERTPCRGWTVARIDAEGHLERHTEGVLAHTAGPSELTPVGEGFAVAVSSDHVGSHTELYVEALARGGASPFEGQTLAHYRDLRLAVSGGSLYVVAQPTEDDMQGSALGHLRAFGAAASSTRVRPDRYGGEVWPALRSRALRCRAGRPVIALRWAGGSATLDPTAAGGFIRWSSWVSRRELPGLEGDGPTPPLAFTGRVLVAWDAGGWNRWRCGAGASIVPAS
ncbi:MAG: hypothetical protein R3A48_16780 [Polyangiales bacterium]